MSWLSNPFKSDKRRQGTPEDVVRFYKGLGFFAGAAAADVIRQYREELGQPPNPAKSWDDAELLSFSENDVWADDQEADVCAGNKIYEEVLPQWAAISRGAFAPSAIAEKWDSEEGPVTVSFQLNGQAVSVLPLYKDDWIDMEILLQINRLIGTSGYQFQCTDLGNMAVVLCLTPAEKEAMKKERDFPFFW
jgi:hypothetical protein